MAAGAVTASKVGGAGIVIVSEPAKGPGAIQPASSATPVSTNVPGKLVFKVKGDAAAYPS